MSKWQRRLVKLGDVPKAITDAIYEYNVAVEVASEEAVKKSATQTRNFMKRKTVTPEQKASERTKKRDKNRKPYRTVFKVYSPKKKRKVYHWRVIGNQHYRLDHLLQDGHEVYNKAGGPYEIHNENRVDRGISGSGWADNMRTTYYKMWEKGYKFADESFYGDLLDTLEDSGCITRK